MQLLLSVVMHFYPGTNKALQMDVLSGEQKIEKRSCSLFFLHYSSAWSAFFKLILEEVAITQTPLPSRKTWH